MTFIVLVLLFTLGFGVLLAVELLRTRQGDDASPLSANEDRLISFEPLQRLLDQEDAGMLQSNPALARKLDANRRQVLRAYLKELRAEFLRAFNVCRLLAPVSHDPEFVSSLVRSYAMFHLTYYSLWVGCVSGIPVDASKIMGLKQPLEQMRSRATALLDMDAALAANSSAS